MRFPPRGRPSDEVRTVADELGETPAQVALAWLLAKGDDAVPIPGTKHGSRAEENTAADITLTAEQTATLDRLIPPRAATIPTPRCR